MMDFNNRFAHYIGGHFVPGDEAIEVLNPATESRIGEVPDGDADLVDEAVRAAKTAQIEWARLPAQSRALHLHTIANRIRDELPRLARIVSIEQGKVLPLAQMEVSIAAEYCDYMAEWARRIEGEIIPSDRPGENIFLFRRPMGVVGAILPWNFPFFMIARKLSPALITGNAIVVKPSEETPYSAYAFAEIIAATDLPKGVFNLVGGRGRSTGAALVRHPGIDMVSFTGSSAAGSAIMEAAAKNLTKLSLELGGKAPAIVLEDANIDVAVAVLKVSKTINSGQACNCAERVYVQRRIADEFKDKLAAAMATIRFGDPQGAAPVDMGPLINLSAVERLGGLIDDARAQGAQVLTGGGATLRGGGFHFQPTVIANTTSSMDIMKREIFGPVLVVNAIDDLEQGIRLANDSDYGLSSSIFTTNLNSAMKAIAALKFGETYVNRENFEAIQGFHAGVRKSGIGGADGKHGVYEYTHTQVAYIQS